MLYDIIPLPSRGFFYENKIDEIKLGFLTTEDEFIISSPNSLNSSKSLYELLKTKIEPFNAPLKVDDLLVGDKETILLFLRETAHGSVINSKVGKDEIYLNLNDIQIRNLKFMPDVDDKYYSWKYYSSNYVLKLLTVRDEKELDSIVDTDGIDRSQSRRIIKHIVSINGETDRDFISNYYKKSGIVESNGLKHFINDIQIGLKNEVKLRINDMVQKTNIPIDTNLFGVDLKNHADYRSSLSTEIYVLVKHGRFNYDDIMKMPTYLRHFFLLELHNEMKKRKEHEDQQIAQAKQK